MFVFNKKKIARFMASKLFTTPLHVLFPMYAIGKYSHRLTTEPFNNMSYMGILYLKNKQEIFHVLSLYWYRIDYLGRYEYA